MSLSFFDPKLLLVIGVMIYQAKAKMKCNSSTIFIILSNTILLLTKSRELSVTI